MREYNYGSYSVRDYGTKSGSEVIELYHEFDSCGEIYAKARVTVSVDSHENEKITAELLEWEDADGNQVELTDAEFEELEKAFCEADEVANIRISEDYELIYD